MTVRQVQDRLALQLGERNRLCMRQPVPGRTGHVERLVEQRQLDQVALGDRQRHHRDVQVVLLEAGD